MDILHWLKNWGRVRDIYSKISYCKKQSVKLKPLIHSIPYGWQNLWQTDLEYNR